MNDRADQREFSRRLARRLDRPLPGTQAQIRLSPRPRIGWTPGDLPDSARPGAGLVLLYPRKAAWHTVLTLRNAELNQHAGQLSLPGGAMEPGETATDTALREAHEEIGVGAAQVEVVGSLTPLYIPVSGFTLHPVVAVARAAPDFVPDPREVQRLYEVGLDELRDRGRHEEELREYKGMRYRVPFVRVHDQKLWGATAMVFAELLVVLEGMER